MHFADAVPFVRYVHTLDFPVSGIYSFTAGYDCRLFFSLRGRNEIRLADSSYTLEENDLLYIPSGVFYRLSTPKGDARLLGINFDFTRCSAHLKTPIVPEAEERFRPAEKTESAVPEGAPCFYAAFAARGCGHLLPLLQEMREEYATKRCFFEEKNSALLKAVLSALARSASIGSADAPSRTVDRIIEFIRGSYATHLSNADIGEALNFHPNYLNRLMLRQTGVSLHRYLLNYRLTKAIDLLQTTLLPVKEIALLTGFSNAAEFSKFFRQNTGKAPGDYR